MSHLLQSRSAFLLIDIQDGFSNSSEWGPSRSNPSFEGNISSLLAAYRSLISSSQTDAGSPHKVIHVAHVSYLSYRFRHFAIKQKFYSIVFGDESTRYLPKYV